MLIKDYFAPSFHCIARGIYSAGQSCFAAQDIAKYLFKNSSKIPIVIMPISAVIGSLGVNFFTRFPANFKLARSYKNNIKLNEPIHALNNTGKTLSYLFQISGHVTNFFNAINAYFGSLLTLETIFEFFNDENDEKDDQAWKQALIQSASCLIAFSALVSFYAYEYQIIKKNGDKIAYKLSSGDYKWNNEITKTIAFSSLTIVASPILAKFWTSSALAKMPYANKILNTIGIECVTWSSSFFSLITGIATLPSTYDFFLANKSVEEKNYNGGKFSHPIAYFTSIEEKDKNSIKLVIKSGAYFVGIVDSLFAGAATSYAIISLATNFNIELNYYAALTLPFMVSTFGQNITFYVLPGYKTLINDLFPHKIEYASLPIEEADQTAPASNTHINIEPYEPENADLKNENLTPAIYTAPITFNFFPKAKKTCRTENQEIEQAKLLEEQEQIESLIY